MPAGENTVVVESAVLVPVFKDSAGVLRVVVIVRAPGGRHGSQLGFPGGKAEAQDAGLADTALRESCEEIGLERDGIFRVESLPVAATRSTGFRISPFLAYIERPLQWRLEVAEVVEVLEPSLEYLLDRANHASSVDVFPGASEPRRVEFIRLGEHWLWGASYRILMPLLPRLMQTGWPL